MPGGGIALDERWIAATASALLAAEWERIPIEALSVRRPDLSLSMAYRVQAAAVARQVAGGAHVVGHKAGVTSRAMQEQMGVDEPDSGVLLDHMMLRAGSTLASAGQASQKSENPPRKLLAGYLSPGSLLVNGTPTWGP
jgi:2-keto-4-pentenoate hydratase